MKRRWMLLWMICFLCVTTLCVAGCDKGAGAETKGETAKPVRVEAVKRADIAEVLSYPATLRAYNEVRVFSSIPDRILEFPWEDGDEIERGERVALIKKAGMDQGLANMSAQVEGLDAQIANLESELERTSGLLNAGAVAQSAYDRLETQLKSLRAQRKAMLAARGQLAVQAGNAYITAPISGVIASKSLEKGDMAVPQIPLCRILGIDRLKVDIRLVESDVPRVHVDQLVKLYFDAYPDRVFEGKVTSVLPFMDPATRTNTVEVTLDNPKDEKTGLRPLKPGMFGRAELVVAIRDGVVVAPEHALLLDNEILGTAKPGEHLRKAMIVDAESVAHARVVEIGARQGSLYEVKKGLSEGDRIIVRGQHALQDGTRVEVVEASPE